MLICQNRSLLRFAYVSEALYRDQIRLQVNVSRVLFNTVSASQFWMRVSTCLHEIAQSRTIKVLVLRRGTVCCLRSEIVYRKTLALVVRLKANAKKEHDVCKLVLF